MRNLLIYIGALAALSPHPSLALRHGAHQLRDVFAYPKYEVQYLNDLPLAASDAERCKALGVETEEEWMSLRPPNGQRRRLGDGSEGAISQSDRLSLIPMNFSPNDGDTTPYPYLCLLPSSNTTLAQTASMDQVDEMDEIDPAQGWAALSHLDGKCLYSRQGWFTYSYCHNSHIRQFRQAPHPQPHPPSGFVPQEDPKYDAYTLGQAQPAARKSKSKTKALKGRGGSDLQVSNQNQNQNQAKPPTSIDAGSTSHDHTRSVSFGLGASSRYLVQKWSDGTRCDKTGQPRQIEIQVHCSMTTGDMIYMVKELAICSYVIIIHSPHLCSLPGFKAEHTEVEMAPIRCRQVVPDEDFEQWSAEETEKKLGLPFSDKPAGAKMSDQTSHRFGLPPPAKKENEKEEQEREDPAHIIFANLDADDHTLREMLTKALDMLGSRKGSKGSEGKGTDEGGEVGGIEIDSLDGAEEQLVLVSWGEEGDEGALLFEAEMLDGEQRLPLVGEERDALQRVVQEYLKLEEEIGDGDEDEDGRTTGRGRAVDEL